MHDQTGSALETSLYLLLLIIGLLVETHHNNALVPTYLLLLWSLCIVFSIQLQVYLKVSRLLG